MKNWLKRYGISILFIGVALYMLYSNVLIFLSNRSEFDVVYRWQVTSFSLGLIFLTMGVAQLFEANGKKRFANIFSIICSSVLVIFGLIAMFVFDSYIGFWDDMLLMVGLPGFMMVISVIRLRSDGKEILTKKQLKVIDIALSLVIVVIFALILWLYI